MKERVDILLIEKGMVDSRTKAQLLIKIGYVSIKQNKLNQLKNEDIFNIEDQKERRQTLKYKLSILSFITGLGLILFTMVFSGYRFLLDLFFNGGMFDFSINFIIIGRIWSFQY